MSREAIPGAGGPTRHAPGIDGGCLTALPLVSTNDPNDRMYDADASHETGWLAQQRERLERMQQRLAEEAADALKDSDKE